MVRKSQTPPPQDASAHDASSPESARQIWLAGLGAFAKAQEQGGKVFEALVQEGMDWQRKTQSMAEEKLTEASQRMASVAGELSSRASGQWDKLETLFEDRVARALQKMGMPSAREVQALAVRIEALEQALARRDTPARPAPSRPASDRPTARKTPTRRQGE